MLYADLTAIEGGQGRAVLRRRRPAWRRHLGWVFEEAARAHATRLVRRGALPDDLVVGRWWAWGGEPLELDVAGFRDSRLVLGGEARWQSRLLGTREFRALTTKVTRVPGTSEDPLLALWGRSGVTDDVRAAGALGYSLEDVLAAE